MSLLIDIPGHKRALHSLVSSEGPREEQSTPPWVSLGKEHFRVLSCVPPPQVAEHEDQWDQSEYTPVTGAIEKQKKNKLIVICTSCVNATSHAIRHTTCHVICNATSHVTRQVITVKHFLLTCKCCRHRSGSNWRGFLEFIGTRSLCGCTCSLGVCLGHVACHMTFGGWGGLRDSMGDIGSHNSPSRSEFSCLRWFYRFSTFSWK